MSEKRTAKSDNNYNILVRIVDTVHRSSDLKEIYKTALDLVIEVDKVKQACIYLVDEHTNEAVLQAHRNLPSNFVKSASRIASPKGLTWKIINSGKIINIPDAQKNKNIGAAGKSSGFHGVLGIPIFFKDKAIGVIWFGREQEKKFSKQDIELLSTIGSQIAIAISKAKQTQQLEDMNRNLFVLSRISQKVHQSTDLVLIYQSFLDLTRELDIYDIMSLYLIEETGNSRRAVLQTHKGLPDEYLKNASSIPYPKGLTWKVIESGEQQYYENISDNYDVMTPAGAALCPRVIFSFPLKLETQTIGVIHFKSLKRNAFTNEEKDFLLFLNNQIGTAVAKSKVFTEVKERSRGQQELYVNLRSTQTQLIQSEKLASLGLLVSSIAHEINNPLTPILGYSQMLITQKDIEEDKRQRFLEIINRSADKVKKIVVNLLSFARNDTPSRDYADVNQILSQAIEFREYQLRLENIHIEKDLDPKLPSTMVDPNQLQQVFTNIIQNADQAMTNSKERGGTLKICSRRIPANNIEIIFTDSGPGMDLEVQQKIFDPFFTTKPTGVGTGLGLSVSYGIIKEHGGDIVVQSEEGAGTSFAITLPILTYKDYITEEESKQKASKPVSPATNSEKVLIVEDEELVVTLMEGILEADGYSVDLANNGEDALRQIEDGDYSFIVCDIKMPQMNGKDFFGQVKIKNNDLAGKIVFITGDPSDETLKFIEETGNKYLAKPFKIEDFKKTIMSIQ